MKEDIALVYMVAGMSSRFDGEIKQFARVGPNGESLIEYSLRQALKTNFDKIIFIVGYKTEVGFREMFGNEYMGVPVFYTRQEFDSEVRDKPWGTVDALCCARKFLDCPFVVCNGDELYGENSFRIVFDSLRKNKENVTIGFKLGNMLSDTCSVNRGIFEVNDDGYIESIKEMFAVDKSNFVEKNLKLDDLCNVNLFGFRPNVVCLLDAKLEAFRGEHIGTNDECLLSTELSELITDGSMKIFVCSTPDKWMGVTGHGDVKVVRKVILSQSA